MRIFFGGGGCCPYFFLFCFVHLHVGFVLNILYYVILFHTILYYTISYYIMLYRIISYHTYYTIWIPLEVYFLSKEREKGVASNEMGGSGNVSGERWEINMRIYYVKEVNFH